MISFTDVLILLFSWCGLFVGVALTKIAPEEVKSGRGFLSLLMYALGMLMITIVSFYLITAQRWWLLTLVLILSLAAAVLSFWMDWKYMFGLYVAVALAYLLHPQAQFRILTGVIQFLIGFPIGSLLAHEIKKTA